MNTHMIHRVAAQHIIKTTHGAAVSGVADVLSLQQNHFLPLHEKEEPHTQQAQ